MKKKRDKSWYMFTNKTGEVCKRFPGEIAGQMFFVDSLTNCEVHLYDNLD